MVTTTEISEAKYPNNFRSKDKSLLADLVASRQSVTLIGIKRVGISNFLRFFLVNKETKKHFLSSRHLFIPVDLDDLVYVDQSAFWKLTIKRVADAVEIYGHSEIVSFANHKFLESLEINDQMVTIDNIKRILDKLLAKGIQTTFFFIRFDRLTPIITDELMANINRIREVTNYQTCFVFTSLRSLPITFTRKVYLKPANINDSKIVLETLLSQYGIQVSDEVKEQILIFAGGHIQYLNLMVLAIKNNNISLSNGKKILNDFKKDEELDLLSEEIFSSLTKEEQGFLLNSNPVPPQYLIKSGLVKGGKLFNSLFNYHIKLNHTHKINTPEFTKKEKAFFDLLKENLGEIVERFELVETVWPDQIKTGITDWAIDRLVSRLRQKLKAQKSEYRINTVITRGYKLSINKN